MVLPLRPGKFYGSSLPRPRFYTNVKFSDERVDPPVPVNDPLLSWANEAHWSMGGLSMKRLRLQGKIEGNVEKLRKEQDSFLKKNPQIETPVLKLKSKGKLPVVGKGKKKGLDSPLPPPVSRKLKLRSRVVALVDQDDDEEVDDDVVRGVNTKRRRLVRKLGDDFELVADENGKSNGGVGKTVASRTRRTMVLMEDGEEGDCDDGNVGKINKDAADNGDAENTNEALKSVSGKNMSRKNVEKGSVSPAGSRSSPRLKQKSG